MVLGIASFLIYQALTSSLVYFILPSEYAQDPAQYQERRIRLGGIVQTGTVSFNNENLRLSFQVSDSIQSYQVEHYGAPPDLFRENTGVVIEGSFRDELFVSDNLLVKHSEVYEAPEDGHIDLDMLRDSLQ
ncbi:MAG: cytochrome c maturation protein CcmE [Trueperaceae bacterium]|nr:cytochrome c maturation protein CcmE [Trueperaceae bacterium]